MGKLTLSRRDFASSLRGVEDYQCFPLKYGQGCYGDCGDCCSMWVTRIERLKKFPFAFKDISFDEELLGYLEPWTE